MQYSVPSGVLPVTPTRPQHQSYPPDYLRDHDRQFMGHSQTMQPQEPYAAQYIQGLEDSHRMTSDEATSRSASPVSQYAEYVTLDAWSFTEEQMAEEPADRDPKRCAVSASAQMVRISDMDRRPATPFHRPWEASVPSEILAPHHTRPIGQPQYKQPAESTYNRFPSFGHLSSATIHVPPPTSNLQPPLNPVPQLSPQRFGTPTHQPYPPRQPVTPHPYSHQEVAYSRSAVHTTGPTESDQSLIDIVDRMMSELQIIKDQAQLASQRNPSLASPHPGEQPYYNRSPPAQYYDRDYHPSDSQPYACAYPQQPVIGWSPSRPSNPIQSTTFKPTYTPLTPQPSYKPHNMAHSAPSQQPSAYLRERTYRGPIPTIPDFCRSDPSEFTRLKIALDNLLPPDATELFRYQVLLDHLKLEEARLVADAYLNSPTPYSDTMAALTDKFGQPQKLALKKIAAVLNAPDIRHGDSQAFQRFALRVRALVGMLQTLGHEGAVELQCGSHVDRLLSKLPSDLRSEFRRCMCRRPGTGYNLTDFSEWLQYEAWCQDSEGQAGLREPKPDSKRRWEQKRETKSFQPATVLHGTEDNLAKHTTESAITKSDDPGNKKTRQAYCPYCESDEHFLSQCDTFKSFSKDQIMQWIKTNRRCWRCGRTHQAAQCTLKKPCSKCQGKHLQILHDVNVKPAKEGSCLVSSASETLYLDRPAECSRVLLKVVQVTLRHGDKSLDTYAVLDDGSERTMLLPAAAQQLGLQGHSETLALRTIRQDVQTLQGTSVTFQVSPKNHPNRSFVISDAFTAKRLSLADHTYPITTLKAKFKHLQHIPLQPFYKVSPMLLIGADHPHLITPVKPVCLGPPGGPAAIKTRLGWTLQGPARLTEMQLSPQQCLFTSLSPLEVELRRNVEKLWQLDVLPPQGEKQVTRSREDQQAIDLLESKTIRVDVNGILRYATPLLRRKDSPFFQAPIDAVMPRLRGLEKRLLKDPESSAAYETEMKKLEAAGTVARLPVQETQSSGERWYIPHHIVEHNGKKRIVFDCSFQYKGLSLNESLLPGPTLSPSLLGVLLRFREHRVGISGDIRGMFHQVQLLPEDKPLLRFLWRSMQREETPQVYEWQVLPFGTTCSPCCATYALQRHVFDHTSADSEERFSVDKCFYVDNCLQSLPSPQEAKKVIDNLRSLLASGGFEIRQWASNMPEVITHLPPDARSDKLELWLAHDKSGAHESTLGLSWQCDVDTLSYKHRSVTYQDTTMRNIYRVLASQYDPLGFILPYTTRAKILVQQLWDKQRGWDDPNLPHELLTAWHTWESELVYLSQVQLPRCYNPADMDHPDTKRDIHIFCDASEKAYGAVAYLRSEDAKGRVHVAFLIARSRVAPRKQVSVPRLELCAAVTGAQLAKLLKNELTFQIRHLVLWSDSTTVLTWLHSESCRFKVFVGTRVAEIQDTTNPKAWRYVDSSQNPADDLTRGKTLQELREPNRWCQGPAFLQLSPEQWPSFPSHVHAESEDTTELKRSAFCGLNTPSNSQGTDVPTYKTWKELMESLAQELHGASSQSSQSPPASTYQTAEMLALRKVQQENFAEDYKLLQAGKPVTSRSRLLCLSPEFDAVHQVIRVGGRLRRVEGLDSETVHPIVLDPTHLFTKLLIQEYDAKLCHPGPERVFAELRRTVWILRGREAVKRHQRRCMECCRWRSKPAVQRMADLPPPRLRLFKPAFYSCGMDCFGPLLVKIGRRTEKRWGLLFKCLTTRAVHLEVLSSLDLDAFLMALRRFIARRGKPAELYSDQGTNFRGGDKELKEAFSNLSPHVQQQLATQQISFHFNPPAAPHFGGAWEREIRSVKAALYKTIGPQTVSEEVLRTVLTEIESILNSKPLGYVSANVADCDPVTPNSLLMGRPDGSLPQVVYPQSELLGRRRWRHSQVLADRFWTAFVKNYLPGLQVRGKWNTPAPDITVGSVVMMVDHQLPRSLWPIGKVVKVFPGPDGHVRSAEVQIKDKVLTRPIVRLIRLPEIPDDETDAP